MSFNESKATNNFLLGNKVKEQLDIGSVIKNEQAPDQNDCNFKCHYCNRDEQSFTSSSLFKNCIICHTTFCLQCFNQINASKDRLKTNHVKRDDMNHWICFICLKECPCQNCGFDVKGRFPPTKVSDLKCLLCKSSSNLVKIDEKLEWINLSEEKRDKLMEKHNEIAILFESNTKEEKILCNDCLMNNHIIHLLFEENNNKTGIDNDNESNHFDESEKEIGSNRINEKQRDNIAKQLKIDLQNQNNINTNTENRQKKETVANIINNQLNQSNNVQSQSIGSTLNLSKDIIESLMQNHLNTLPNSNSDFMQQQQPSQASMPSQFNALPLSVLLTQQAIPNLDPHSLSFIHNQLNQQLKPVTAPTSSSASRTLKNSFANITQLMQNYNDQSIQTNLNVLSNLNQLVQIISKINENKTLPDQNNGVDIENVTMKRIWDIIQNIKIQIKNTNDLTQIQSGLIVQVMKTLEQSMQQEAMQNLMNNQMNNQFQMNSMMPQSQYENNDYLLQGLLEKMPFNPNPNMMPMCLNSNMSNMNTQNENSILKPRESPSSNRVIVQSKEDNTLNSKNNNQDNKQLGQPDENNSKLNFNSFSNTQFPNLLIKNLLNPLMNRNPNQGNSSNCNNMQMINNHGLPLNPNFQSIPNPNLNNMPMYLYNNPIINQFPVAPKPLVPIQIPNESNFFQGQTINHGLPQIYTTEINQGLSQSIDIGLQQRMSSLSNVQSLQPGIPPNFLNYLNHLNSNGDPMFSFMKNQPGSGNDSIKNSNSQDDALPEKKNK